MGASSRALPSKLGVVCGDLCLHPLSLILEPTHKQAPQSGNDRLPDAIIKLKACAPASLSLSEWRGFWRFVM